MSTVDLDALVKRSYQHGFVTDIDSDTVAPGLDEDVVRLISRKKREPQFLLDWRLKALRHWYGMREPHWAQLRYAPIDYAAISYYSAPKRNGDAPKSLADVDPKLLATYDRVANACHLTYARSDSSPVTLSYEEMRRRLFLMSFDPYHCVERRWGATDATELSTCREGGLKEAWYAAEQSLRNQLDRTYEAKMDWSLPELQQGGAGIGVGEPPDIDARAYLISQKGKPDAPFSDVRFR